MLADRDALFAGILAAPQDDLRRLVFADHLEESGHPALVARAAYIRLQIEAANAGDEPTRRTLLRHAAALRGQFRDEGDDVRPGVTPTWTRGFVSDLRGSSAKLRTHAAAFCRVAPVTGLYFDAFDADTDWLRSDVCLYRINRLKIGRDAWPFGRDADLVPAEPLLDSHMLIAVEHLDLSGRGFGNDWLLWFLPRLAVAPLNHALRSLDLSGTGLGDPAAALFASARGLDGLTRLDLSENRFTAAGRDALMRRFGPRVVV